MTEPARGDHTDEVLPRDWTELVPLVDQVLDAALEARAALIGELAAGDAASMGLPRQALRNAAIASRQ